MLLRIEDAAAGQRVQPLYTSPRGWRGALEGRRPTARGRWMLFTQVSFDSCCASTSASAAAWRSAARRTPRALRRHGGVLLGRARGLLGRARWPRCSLIEGARGQSGGGDIDEPLAVIAWADPSTLANADPEASRIALDILSTLPKDLANFRVHGGITKGSGRPPLGGLTTAAASGVIRERWPSRGRVVSHHTQVARNTVSALVRVIDVTVRGSGQYVHARLGTGVHEKRQHVGRYW